MSIDIIVVCISGILVSIGSIMLILYEGRKRKLSYLINNALEKKLGVEKEGKLLKGTHYNMSLYTYNKIRLRVATIVAIIGIIIMNEALIISTIVGYIALYPKESISKVKLPFGLIYQSCRKKDKAKKNDELLEILSLLKNMMVQLRNSPKGADYNSRAY